MSAAADTFQYGFHPLRETLRQRPQDVVRIVCAAQPGKRRDEIESQARRHGVGVEAVAWQRLDELSAGGVHNGFGFWTRAEPVGRGVGDPELVVLLEDVQDPRNLGAILRVCEGAGVGRVLIRDRGSAPVGAAAIKTSAGASEHLAIERITNPAQSMAALKAEGYWIYGADAAGQPPWSVELTGRVVLCLGGEQKGLRELTRKSCDALIGLPMRGRVESLNVATAAAALLYEAVRQRSSG